jgi:hypothetical protein
MIYQIFIEQFPAFFAVGRAKFSSYNPAERFSQLIGIETLMTD